MNVLDIILGLVLLLGAWRGYKKGLVMEICTLLALGAGIWLAINFSDRVAEWLQPRLELGTWLGVAAFAITFLLALIGVNLLGRMITKAMDLAMLSMPNRFAGAIFGVLKYGSILSVAVNVYEGFDPEQQLIEPEQKELSKIYEPIRSLVPFAVPAVKESKWFQATMKEVETMDLIHDQVGN